MELKLKKKKKNEADGEWRRAMRNLESVVRKLSKLSVYHNGSTANYQEMKEILLERKKKKKVQDLEMQSIE